MSSQDPTRSPDPAAWTPRADRPPQIRAEHLGKLAIVYVRQSTAKQVRDNTGSTDDQLALADLPRRWGWAESRIKIIAHDLGLSGTSAARRTGFQELLDLIGRGEVGMVLVREVSRLSRNQLDAQRFLTAAIEAGVLIWANGRIFDTASQDLADEFGLQIQTLLAWFENQHRTRALHAAARAKARKGHAVSRPPIGYVVAVRGKWVKDPDPKVQDAVRRIFTLYLDLGSIGKVVKYHREHQLLFPRRVRGQLIWEPLMRSAVERLLQTPQYTGDYVFGRMRWTRPSAGQAGKNRRRPPSEWTIAEAHHEPYVTREEGERIQAALANRRPTVRPPICKGPALLQGLVVCARCGRWMRTTYPGRDRTKRIPSYRCRPLDPWGRVLHVASSRAWQIDRPVVAEVLKHLTPDTIQAAAAAIEEFGAEQAAIQKMHSRLLQQAEDDVAEARRRYQLVDPENRLVKADLEAALEQALHRLDEAKQAVAAGTGREPLGLTPAAAAELTALIEDLLALWEAPTTTNEDRKRLLHSVIAQVVVDVRDDAINVEIVWAGGSRQPLRILRPKGVDEVIREHAKSGKTARESAAELQASRLVSRYGRPLSVGSLHQRRQRLGVNPKALRPRVLRLIWALLTEGWRRRDILDVLPREFPLLGTWSYGRLVQTIYALRRGVAGLPPLPKILPADRVLEKIIPYIERRRREDQTWQAIADELNAAGIRPPKAARFSASQVFSIAHGRRSSMTRPEPSTGSGGTSSR